MLSVGAIELKCMQLQEVETQNYSSYLPKSELVMKSAFRLNCDGEDDSAWHQREPFSAR